MHAAHRELYEETGCSAELLEEICIYSVSRDGSPFSHGMLYRARIGQPGLLPPESEMACVRLFQDLPDAWTYPDIQPKLLSRAWME